MIPKWAASIWADSDYLHLQLPSPICDSSYRVKLPRTEKGLSQALLLLSQRGEHSTIGKPGSPTNYELEQLILGYVAKHKPRKPKPLATPQQRSTIRALMRKMELI